MGETFGGGVEIECWREVVPVLLHETRRLTVHIQFRSIKFSVMRREFHIKLSSEEDQCFLYKAAVTHEVYQRFAHCHNLDVPFEHFPEYMHHLIHSVKNNHEYGDRFFISILAPQTITNVPHSIEFIVTQRQLGCLVQCRRLSLNFSLASDNELKEHLINGFERFKREKDIVQRRCNDVEVELANERLRIRELEEKNRYLQRELEFSQTLLKSAETLQKHYESLLKQQQYGYKPSTTYTTFQTVDHAQNDAADDPAASSSNDQVPLLSADHFSDAASANFQHSRHAASYPTLHPESRVGQQPQQHHRNHAAAAAAAATTSVHVMGMSVYLDSVSLEPSASAHMLDCSPKLQQLENHQQQPSRHGSTVPQRKDASVIAPPAFHNMLSGKGQQQQPPPLTTLLTCAAFETSPSSSVDPPPLHAFLTPPADCDIKRSIDTCHVSVAPQSARHLESAATAHNRQSLETADFKKLTGAAKRKASFHNLTNTNPSAGVATHNGAEPQQHAATSRKLDIEQCDPRHLAPHPMTNRVASSAVDHQHFGVATSIALNTSDQQVVSMDDDSHTAAATLASMPHHLNVLIDEGNADVDNFCNGNSAAAASLVPFLEAGALHGFLPDDLDTNGAAMSPVLGQTSADADLMDSLAELTDADWRSMKVDDFDQSASSVVVVSPSSEMPRLDDSSKPSPPMDGVLSYLKCLICDRSFDLGSAHMAQHVTQARTCSVCGDSPVFESKDELIKHMLSHSARIYACQYCGKENPRIHYLKIHVRSHTGEKPYTCHQCGRGFADASTWRRHERVHTGEKPFQCNICGRKIARRDNVKIHMRSHMRTKQQHAACRTCGKHFTQSHHLMLHERVCSPMPSSGDEKLPSDSFCLGDKSSNF